MKRVKCVTLVLDKDWHILLVPVEVCVCVVTFNADGGKISQASLPRQTVVVRTHKQFTLVTLKQINRNLDLK